MAKFLANENVPFEAVAFARQKGFDVQWVGEQAPGATDEVVLDSARADGRVLLTFDKDFGHLAFRLGKQATSGVILLRPRLRSPAYLAEFMHTVLSQQVDWQGHFSVAQEGRLRVIALPP